MFFLVHSNHCKATHTHPTGKIASCCSLKTTIQTGCPAISLSYPLTCWFIDEDKFLCVELRLQAPPLTEWSVRLQQYLPGRQRRKVYLCSPISTTSAHHARQLAYRVTGGPACDHPVQHPPVSSVFSLHAFSFPPLVLWRILPFSNKSKGVCLALERQLVSRRAGTEVLCQKLFTFISKSVLALLRGLPPCIKWVDVENGVNVKYWNSPSIFSG